MIKKLIRNILSRPFFQPIFESILNISLKVLNVGEGQSVETSGEVSVFKILNKIANKNGAVVFDIGAHTGEWFGLFKKHYLKKSSVYSFEPSQYSYEKLLKIKSEGFYPENFALGEIPGKKYLLSNEKGSVGSYIAEEKKLIIKKFSEEIMVTTLDQYCYEHKIQSIDLLKLDVEGYELKILKGSKEMLKNGSIKLIQFEFGASSEEKYALKDFFDILDKQYQICRILKNGYYPLKKYKHYYEIMSVTNFIAIKRDLFY